MRPIAPRTGAPEQTIAEEQEEYLPITIGLYLLQDSGMYGRLLRYTFTAAERQAIACGEDVYFMQLYSDPSQPMTPVSARVGPDDWKVD